MKKSDILENFYGEFVQEKYKDIRMESDNKLDEDNPELVERLTEPYFWAWYARGANDNLFKRTHVITLVKNMGFDVRTTNALLYDNIIDSEDIFRLIDEDRLSGVRGLGAKGQDIVMQWVEGQEV